MKRNAIYYRFPNGEMGFQSPSQYKTREDILEQIASMGWKLSSKKEFEQRVYDRVYPSLKKALDEANIEEVLRYVKWNNNPISFRAFRDLTGVKLSPVMKVRIPQIQEYFGDKWGTWRARKQAEREARIAEREARYEKEAQEWLSSTIEKWRKGEWIDAVSFLRLCRKFEVEMHPRTKGFVFRKVFRVNSKGNYWQTKGARSEQFYLAVTQLNEAIKDYGKEHA